MLQHKGALRQPGGAAALHERRRAWHQAIASTVQVPVQEIMMNPVGAVTWGDAVARDMHE
jgi:hypothetical protein